MSKPIIIKQKEAPDLMLEFNDPHQVCLWYGYGKEGYNQVVVIERDVILTLCSELLKQAQNGEKIY